MFIHVSLFGTTHICAAIFSQQHPLLAKHVFLYVVISGDFAKRSNYSLKLKS